MTPAERAGQQVLLVDDDPIVLQVVSEVLSSEGYEVVAAERAAEALALLQGGLAPDLLITDHMMPGMTGAELLAQVHRTWPALPMLMITGFMRDVATLPGHVPVLGKPFGAHALLDQVRALA